MKNYLNIGYFADGPWSHLAFEKIVKDTRFNIKFIVPRFDTRDETLSSYAENYNIDYFKLKNINAPDALKKISSYECDLLVSMSFNQIFKKEIINLAPLKIINCHAGKLPFYRGRNILNWVLINDEKEFGITVHYVDEGIDTGDIISQRIFPINDDDDYKTLLELSYTECASILYETLLKFLENDIRPVPQNMIHPLGTYCGRRIEGDEIIDWTQTSRQVFNFIRSVTSPGPKAHSYIKDRLVRINKAIYFPDAPVYLGKPGQVLTRTEKGYLVKTKDSFIEILEVDNKLRIGEQFEPKMR